VCSLAATARRDMEHGSANVKLQKMRGRGCRNVMLLARLGRSSIPGMEIGKEGDSQILGLCAVFSAK
jgi:hypothetical protein